MSARELTNLYLTMKLLKEPLLWSKTAKTLFEKANRKVHADWMNLYIFDSYYYATQYDKAEEALDSIDSLAGNFGANFSHKLKTKKAKLYASTGRLEESLKIYTELLSANRKLNQHAYNQIADIYVQLDSLSKAEKILASIEKFEMEREDSAYRFLVKSRLYRKKNNFQDAYESMLGLYNMLSKSLKDSHYPDTYFLTEHYKTKASNKQLESEKRSQTLIYVSLIAGLVVILLITLVYLMKTRLSQKELEIERHVNDAENLRLELMTKSSHTESVIPSGEEFRRELRTLFQNHIDSIDKLCNIYYRYETLPDERKLRNEILQYISSIQTTDVTDELRVIIDRYDDNWMSKFKQAYPMLSDNDYSLIMYLYVGFSAETISLLMNKKTLQLVYTAKYKLKRKLESIDPDDTVGFHIKCFDGSKTQN